MLGHCIGPNENSKILLRGALKGVSAGARTVPWKVWLCGGALLSSETFLRQIVVFCCDPKLAAVAEIQPSWFWQYILLPWVCGIVSFFTWLAVWSPAVASAQTRFNTFALRAILGHERLMRGKDETFSDAGSGYAAAESGCPFSLDSGSATMGSGCPWAQGSSTADHAPHRATGRPNRSPARRARSSSGAARDDGVSL